MAVTRIEAEDGVALAMAVMTVLMLSVAAAALLLSSSSETIIAAHFRSSVEAHYAAEAALVRAIGLLNGLADWTAPITGATQSALVDGPPGGTRTVPGGSTIDLASAVNLANCQKTTSCSTSDLGAVTADRPWGPNNPVWQLFAYGPLSTLLVTASGVTSPHYVLLLVADDPTGTHRPQGPGPAALSREGIAMRAEVFGPRGAHAVIEVIAGREADASAGETDYNSGAGPRMNIVSWREVR
jgi:hypothetical protein